MASAIPTPVVELGEYARTDLAAGDAALLRSVLPTGRAAGLTVSDTGTLETQGCVGSLCVGETRIRITPKLPGLAEHLTDLLAFAYGLDWQGGATRVPQGSRWLPDLIVGMLLDEIEQVVRIGLRRAYVEAEDALHVLRGRPNWQRQLALRQGLPLPLECDFEEFTLDTADNRLLRDALRAASRLRLSEETRERALRLHEPFEQECSEADGDWQHFEPRYDRLNAYYRSAHRLALLLLRREGIDDLLWVHPASRSAPVSAFLLDMPAFFERIVGRLLGPGIGPPGIFVQQQRQWAGFAADAVGLLSRGSDLGWMRPDFLLGRNGAVTAVLDAKYKAYAERTLAPADLYQVSAYVTSLTAASQEPPVGAIIHPEIGAVTVRPYRLTGPDGTTRQRFVALGLDLSAIAVAWRARDETAVRSIARQVVEALLPPPTPAPAPGW